MSVRSVLDSMRLQSKDEHEKGRKFEQLMRAFLKTDLQYARMFDEVWLWMDYPGRAGRPDTGIDLVAREKNSGDLIAIQCKFYAPETVISKPDVDSFLASSSKSEFKGRLFITTTDLWGKNAKTALEGQNPPVSIMSLADLDESSIDWSTFSVDEFLSLAPKDVKLPRRHQVQAIESCLSGLAVHDRGRLVMACGTGKTFTSLRLTESYLPHGGTVLFLVPSISLLSQAVKEWSINAQLDLSAFAVCSDASTGNRRIDEDLTISDLAFPATTDSVSFMSRFESSITAPGGLRVVFSTYQSIGVVSEAQAAGLPVFDLIICDEAHRTTGVTVSGSESSAFMRVHDNDFIKAKKRLYMTATPKVFSDSSKLKAEDAGAVIADMNDEETYGPELHRLGFGEAVERDILTDYKVLILAVDEQYVAEKFQKELASSENELNLEDTAKIVGCWNGLSKRGLASDDFDYDPEPMKRAVVFARSIAESKMVATMFQQVVDRELEAKSGGTELSCDVEHVDGTFSSFDRNEKLNWLKEEATPNTARILTNARCLTEGVDVPSLDAVMFLKPRDSQIDVVQAVGRVMRKAEGKKYGYVILPIAVAAGVDPETALSDNKKYKVVWQVLQALRSHDERFDAMVNRIDLTGKSPNIEILGISEKPDNDSVQWSQSELQFPNFDSWKDAILAKVVERVGERRYWERWAGDIAEVARRQIQRIDSMVSNGAAHDAEFSKFLKGLQDNLHPSITKSEAVEMLAQHQITKPIFDSLFGDYKFTSSNPVSQVMGGMLEVLSEGKLETETAALDEFYKSVSLRVGGLTKDSERQHVIKQLYEQFFKTAFPDTADRLGIVYTPNEVVDFINYSIESILKADFGSSINDPNVHLLDPFTGTGTFIVRLLQSGIINNDAILEKYRTGLHANELVLLAYYIAAINIESTVHSITDKGYEPFGGLVLTDTFQLYESENELDNAGVFRQNNARAEAQLSLDIKVIFGNPPYSKGQDFINDDNQNLSYPSLDTRISDTYARLSSAQNKNSLYDSYIRAMRWASDRVGDSGLIAFVSNGGFIDGSSAAGIRRTLVEEFDKVYVLNLRGNARTSGEERKAEGGTVFGSGSRSTVAIYFLVKTSAKGDAPGQVFYADVGDYLTQEEKLERLSAWGALDSVDWKEVAPDKNGDWINQRDESFSTFIPIGSKAKGDDEKIFKLHSGGVSTSRDAWASNHSKRAVEENMARMLSTLNQQVDSAAEARRLGLSWARDNDPTKISWLRPDERLIKTGKKLSADDFEIVRSMYRPFVKTYLAFGAKVNDCVYQLPKVFSSNTTNRAIVISGVGAAMPFSAFMVSEIPDASFFGAQSNAQVFGERSIEVGISKDELGLFAEIAGHASTTDDNLSAGVLSAISKRLGRTVSPSELFDYVYGVLNWPAYREQYSVDLKKELPRIPITNDFETILDSGRKLAELHLNYESLPEFPLEVIGRDAEDFHVIKMKYGKNGRVEDKTIIHLNERLQVRGIPLEAHEFTLGAKSAIDWIVERYCIKVDKKSGIVNDANEMAKDDPQYPLRLISKVVTLAMESKSIRDAMPDTIVEFDG